jgi:hypothetical protein
MNIKKVIKHCILGESLKEIEINRILDKICRKRSKLTKKEKVFLDLYNETQKVENKDWMLLSKSVVATRVKEFISNGIKVICDLHDRDGKIGLEIIDVINDYEDELSTLILKGDVKHDLHDKFLYNLIYNLKKDYYSLEEQDEYFEKIEANND